MWKLVVLSLLTAVCLPNIADAHWKSGNQIFSECNVPKNDATYYQNQGWCNGFILGVADVMGGGDTVATFKACFRTGVTVQQLHDVTNNYLIANPQYRHMSAHILVAKALSDVFPCSN